MMDALARYIAEQEGKHFVLGINDCATFVADWVFLQTAVDTFRDYRGAYSTIEARDTVLSGSSIADIFRKVAKAHRFYEREDAPRRGDVGAFMSYGSDLIFNHEPFSAMGIFTGSSWVGRTPHGILKSKTCTPISVWAMTND